LCEEVFQEFLLKTLNYNYVDMLAALKANEVFRVFTDVFGNCQFLLKEM